NVLLELGRHDEALRSYDHALQLNPTLADACNNRGNALRELKRPDEALQSYERALKINPNLNWLYGAWLHTKLQLCDWADFESAVTDLTSRIVQGRRATRPFTVLALTDALSVQRRVAEISSDESALAVAALPPIAMRGRREIIRVGYYSADFHNHATAQLMVGLFELHDRKRFEVSAFSFGPDRHDHMTERLRSVFDRFVDVRSKSDHEVAQISRDLEIDIAVDLKGFTQDSRPGIFAHRAAPLQVNYLGYPGTMAANYIDYIVADPTVIPRHTRHHYSEKVIYLPNSYYPTSYRVNDRERLTPDAEPSRAQLGLPQAGFIFCCFNSAYKIVPGTFKGWMRILKAVEGSVLWLLSDNQTAANNLRKEADKQGVSGTRVIIAAPLPLAQHLTRYRAADLFLDTLPCNAHTTASDALWAGLPVVTRAGESLAARVAASLLSAIGLPELVTSTEEQYQALAVALATDPQRMTTIKSQLKANRLTTPLFDTRLLTSHLENGYAQIYRRYHAGLSPDDVLVPADLSPAPA
ncbi:MAG TPA: tetratricopeptide repeat protein, partial [Steroidobacteraceae bacterium]